MSAVATKPQTVADVALSVREISVSYGGVKAVDDVTFDVPSGGILGLIGPNGAGKTTVFDAICGFVQLERGRVLLEDREITTMSPTDRARTGLGRSFQDARLFPSLTVFEALSAAFERHMKAQDPVSTALSMPWVRRTERRVRERVEELIGLMGLEAFRDKFISELSTGSRRIVDLSCVLAHDPKVLLLDEPSSGIAQKETEALGPLLRRVQEATGCTMLLIEHDMPLVTSVSDELIALETGRIIARGKPHDVTTHPLVVEAYLGTDERIVARSGEAVAATDGRPARKRSPAKKKTQTKKEGAASRKKTTSRSSAKKPAKKTTKKTSKKTSKRSGAKSSRPKKPSGGAKT